MGKKNDKSDRKKLFRIVLYILRQMLYEVTEQKALYTKKIKPNHIPPKVASPCWVGLLGYKNTQTMPIINEIPRLIPKTFIGVNKQNLSSRVIIICFIVQVYSFIIFSSN